MTPKEKAEELVNKMIDKQEYSDVYQEKGIISWSAKQCALIAVDEVLKTHMFGVEFFYYWDDVKHEINNL